MRAEDGMAHQGGLMWQPPCHVRAFIRLSRTQIPHASHSENARPCTHFVISTPYISISLAIMKSRPREYVRELILFGCRRAAI